MRRLQALFAIALGSSFIFLGCTALAPLASAQEASEDQETGDQIAIEEIIVTASRREQSLKEVPAAVTALAPEDFTARGLTDLKMVLQHVPSIRVDDGGNPGEGNISARGVPQAGATPVFGIYVDDTPLSSNSSFGAGAEVFFDGTLMDLERVEVIKGPQGTLYGATSVGGMLRYITREPALDRFRASAGVNYMTVEGGDNGYIANARFSVPIIEDKLGITLSGFRQDDPGYVDYVDGATGDVLLEDAEGNEVEGYSADLLFVPTDALKIRLKYMEQNMDTALTSSVILAGTDSDQGMFGDYTNTSEPGIIFLDYEIMSASFSYDFGGMTLTGTTSHTEYISGQESDFSFLAFLVDALGLQPPGVTTTSLFLLEDEGAERTAHELRLTSQDSDKLEWIVGFFYADEDTFTNQALVSVPPVPDLATVSFPSIYKEFAGFGNLTYYVTENFDLTAGVRVSDTEISLSLFQTGPFVGPTVDFQREVIKDTVDTYLFAARYRVDEDVSLYSRVASGYRPASTNLPLFDPGTGEDISNPILEADDAWSYEVGAKGSFADGMADFDVSLWYIDWDNFQALFTLGGGVTVSANAAGGLSAQGIEGSLTVRPTPALTLMANLGYTKSELNEDTPEIGGLKDVQYPDLPKWNGSAQFNYDVDLPSDWSGYFGGGLRYRGSFVSGFPASTTGGIAVPVDGELLADVNFNVTNGQFEFGLYVTNLFDNRALNDRSDNEAGPGAVNSFGNFERPRTFGVTLRYDY
jgi:outer membrane receptor protein involved in Fe transport